MGTAASTAGSGGTSALTSFSKDELKDPKSVMLESARNGKQDELLLVIEQGMDPNEREAPFSG